MKVYESVRGSMKSVPNIEVNVDTVYIRRNVKAIEEEGFKGWEYDEIQYDKDEYIELISERNDALQMEQTISNMELIGAMQMLNMQNEVTQAEMLMEIGMLIMQLQGGE